MFATSVRGEVDRLKEALKKGANINGQTRFVSYIIL